MSKKNIFLLAAGYVAGGIIGALYNKKNPSELKKDLEKSRKEGTGDFKVILDNFIVTHENLLKDLKNHVLTDKNKEMYNEKKEELLNVVDVYKKQGLELVDELKVKGKDFIVIASDNLDKLYKEKKAEIEYLKESAPEIVNEIKDDLKEGIKKGFSEVKDKIKK